MAKQRISKSAKYVGKHHISMGGIAIGTGLELGGRLLSGEKLSLGTIAKSAIAGTAYELIHPGLLLATTGATLLSAAGVAMYGSARNQQQRWKDNRQTGMRATYTDSQQALTMRQAAVQAIQGSRMNARNALGGEAAMMHRSWYR